MWSSCFGKEGQNKKHENDENCKTHPEANHDGICGNKTEFSGVKVIHPIFYIQHTFCDSTHITQYHLHWEFTSIKMSKKYN